MKIVDLDGYALNPGDISWEGFEQLGELTNYDRTQDDDATILKRIGDAEIVLTNKTRLDENVIENAPKLKYIGVLATGYNVIDIDAAKKKNVIVTNIPSYGTDAVAQHTFALLLEITNQVGLHSEAVRNGEWQIAKDFTFWKAPLISLTDKTLGIIGFGRIGQAVAQVAHSFGMKVIFYNHHPKDVSADWVKQVSLEDLYAKVDVITLHTPQTSETEKMINRESIAKMKAGVILINTARGGLLNEADVADALNSGKLYALGADVASEEPINRDNPLLTAKNVFLTPHIAWAATEIRARLMGIAVDNLKAYLAGEPENVVD
ncbi:D-2-hydroxyacid dehydrogenase [Lentilactobacillus kisonensis]|uniref:Putative glycerate dehydrogenase n=1 Tax=Lentilactobacillus kisonensis F0435 TaxID=797516 RepID=H1LFW7_9LACO|nr:D-2-hydroxyacid dehydrogenase [Lentilactobacillus kisonensis]EHO51436.1 putative glycerate dehydrogenase [Lentilactobacillus kisonensis F0435]